MTVVNTGIEAAKGPWQDLQIGFGPDSKNTEIIGSET
jgi:hypothetical protein